MSGSQSNAHARGRPPGATEVGRVRHLHEHLHGYVTVSCGAGANSMRPATMAPDPNGGLSWQQAEGSLCMARAGEPKAA